MGRKTKQNRVVTEELIAQVNAQNLRLLDDYVTYMRSVKRSEETIAGYVNDLRIFFCWLVQNAGNKYFVDISKRDVVGFQGFMVNTLENSPARIRRMKSSLSALSNYIVNLLDDEYPNFKNIVNKVENPLNEPVREKTVLSDEQLQSLLDHLVEEKQCQKACLVALAAASGARKAELVRFKVDFFVPENIMFGSLYQTPKIKTKGRSGGKYISKFVLKELFQPYFDLWMAQRKELGIDSEWLFVTSNDSGYEQLNSDTITSWMETCGNYLGVDCYAHMYRHYFTTLLSKRSLPSSVIKDLCGWQNEALISVYNDETKESAFSKYFDENGFKPASKASLDTL